MGVLFYTMGFFVATREDGARSFEASMVLNRKSYDLSGGGL